MSEQPTKTPRVITLRERIVKFWEDYFALCLKYGCCISPIVESSYIQAEEALGVPLDIFLFLPGLTEETEVLVYNEWMKCSEFLKTTEDKSHTAPPDLPAPTIELTTPAQSPLTEARSKLVEVVQSYIKKIAKDISEEPYLASRLISGEPALQMQREYFIEISKALNDPIEECRKLGDFQDTDKTVNGGWLGASWFCKTIGSVINTVDTTITLSNTTTPEQLSYWFSTVKKVVKGITGLLNTVEVAIHTGTWELGKK